MSCAKRNKVTPLLLQMVLGKKLFQAAAQRGQKTIVTYFLNQEPLLCLNVFNDSYYIKMRVCDVL